MLLCLIAPPEAALLHARAATAPRAALRMPSVRARADNLLLPRRGPVPILPELSDQDVRKLSEGKFLQRQLLDGPDGSGFAVQEVRAGEEEAWRCISDFDTYAARVKTVRTVAPYVPESDGRFGVLAPGESCYDFLVSRIRLPLAVRFTKHEPDKYVSWVLDRPSWILRESTGFWHVQPVPERQGYVRIWFCVAVRLTARVPGFVVSLVSRVGLRKACFWVRRALEGDDGGDELPIEEPESLLR